MKIDQIAFWKPDGKKTPEQLIDAEMVKDTVIAENVWVRRGVRSIHPEEKDPLFTVDLWFDHSVMSGVELEYLGLRAGWSCQAEYNSFGMCHVGAHVPDLMAALVVAKSLGRRVLQVTATREHTGTERRYMYGFVDTANLFYVPLKLIQRVEEGPAPDKKTLLGMLKEARVI